MRRGKILTLGLLTAIILWGTIIFKVTNTTDFLKNNIERPGIITAVSNHYLGETEVEKLMENKIPGANLFSIKLENNGSNAVYKGGLQKGNMEYSIIVDAKTGEVISLDSNYITSENATKNIEAGAQNDAKIASTQKISSTSSKSNKAVKSVSKSSTSNKNNTTYTKNQSSSNYISRSRATQIMLNKAPGAKMISFRLNGSKYEGRLRKSNTEYKITLSAKTGKVLSFNKYYNNYSYDRDDDDDDEDDDDEDDDDDDEDDDD